MDHASTYGEFVADRQERLDRYGKEHGPHWLWYERPLKVHADARPKMAACAVLTRKDDETDMHPWTVNQCFWKRSGWVARMKQLAGNHPVPGSATFGVGPNGEVFCQADGPKVVFRTMLDSGATYPALSEDDIRDLGIDRRVYACQSVENLHTASLGITCRIYELFVQVVNENNQSLVDSNSPVHPLQPPYLGGLCPVVDTGKSQEYDSEGVENTVRLSGMMPFLACYVQSTPNRPYLFLGEDRKDVLGHHKMPGQRRWQLGAWITTPSRETWGMYGDPVTTFSHKKGQVIDEDNSHGLNASKVIFDKGTPREVVYHVNPTAGVAPL